MLDFSTSVASELSAQIEFEHEREAQRGRWIREARESVPRGEGPRHSLLISPRARAARRRRAFFASALEQAQREGITIDAWFGFRYADPELSARAEWSGLLDEDCIGC